MEVDPILAYLFNLPTFVLNCVLYHSTYCLLLGLRLNSSGQSMRGVRSSNQFFDKFSEKSSSDSFGPRLKSRCIYPPAAQVSVSSSVALLVGSHLLGIASLEVFEVGHSLGYQDQLEVGFR